MADWTFQKSIQPFKDFLSAKEIIKLANTDSQELQETTHVKS